jgi:hypothetical protein
LLSQFVSKIVADQEAFQQAGEANEIDLEEKLLNAKSSVATLSQNLIGAANVVR